MRLFGQSRVDSLQVVEPCSESWDAMAGGERERFCDRCQKNVVNIASLTRPEVEKLIHQTNGSFCGRMQRLPNGRVRTAPERSSIAFRATRWFSGLAFAVSTAFAADQGIRFRVVDHTGAVIPNTKIKVSSDKEKVERLVETGETGEVSLTGLAEGPYHVEVSSHGFKDLKTVIPVEPDRIVEQTLTLHVGDLTIGAMIISERPSLLRKLTRPFRFGRR